MHSPIIVYWLIHSYQLLESQPVWTLAAEPKRRIHVLQHVIHLRIVNTAPNGKMNVKPEVWHRFLRNLLSTWIIFSPDSDELVKVMSSQYRRVSREIIKVVHDDSNEQVEHEEAAEEHESDKEEVGDVTAAFLIRLQEFPRCHIPLDCSGITDLSCSASQHNVRPGFSCGTSINKIVMGIQACHLLIGTRHKLSNSNQKWIFHLGSVTLITLTGLII